MSRSLARAQARLRTALVLLVACGEPMAPPGDLGSPDGARDLGVARDAGGPIDATSMEDGGSGDLACGRVDPHPSALADASALESASGEFRFTARDGHELTAYTHRSASFDPRSGSILFIVHGAGRNAEGYLDAWRDAAEAAGVLAIAPEWPDALYEGSESYNFGVGVDGTPYGGTYEPSEWRAPEDYTHSEIEHLFEAVKGVLGNESCRYRIYGHSSGAQFVHRLITFVPDARVERAVAANAGWYTLPADTDEELHAMPYGLRGAAPALAGRVDEMFAHALTVLLGEEDTVRDDDLRTTPEADAQGANRFERGEHYFATARSLAEDRGLPFRWALRTVPGAGHSNRQMVEAAAAALFR